jgi:hypothetical protein
MKHNRGGIIRDALSLMQAEVGVVGEYTISKNVPVR